MEHWLQLMCCTLAVVLVPYFGKVGGKSRKDKREDEELLKSIFKLKSIAEYIYGGGSGLVMKVSKTEDGMYSSRNCALEG